MALDRLRVLRNIILFSQKLELLPPPGGGLFDPLAASITTYLLNVETAYVLQCRSPCDVGGEQMNKFKTQTNNKKLRFGGYASPCDKMFSF